MLVATPATTTEDTEIHISPTLTPSREMERRRVSFSVGAEGCPSAKISKMATKSAIKAVPKKILKKEAKTGILRSVSQPVSNLQIERVPQEPSEVSPPGDGKIGVGAKIDSGPAVVAKETQTSKYGDTRKFPFSYDASVGSYGRFRTAKDILDLKIEQKAQITEILEYMEKQNLDHKEAKLCEIVAQWHKC